MMMMTAGRLNALLREVLAEMNLNLRGHGDSLKALGRNLWAGVLRNRETGERMVLHIQIEYRSGTTDEHIKNQIKHQMRMYVLAKMSVREQHRVSEALAPP